MRDIPTAHWAVWARRLCLALPLLAFGCATNEAADYERDLQPAAVESPSYEDGDVAGGGVFGDAAQRTLAQQASELLSRAPLDLGRRTEMTPGEFVEATRQLVLEAPSTMSPPPEGQEITTAADAVVTLEALVEAGSRPVVARVRSTPLGLDVAYWPVYKTPGSSPSIVTTDTDLSLRIPAAYYFRTKNPYTGELTTKRIECARGCTAAFHFVPSGTLQP